jgi:acyl-CoA thioester hydrolase
MNDFSFEHEIEVRFRDLDAMGHVNHAVFLSYMEQARVAYWQRVTGLDGIVRQFILARVECDYRAPVTLGERVIVRLRVSRLGRSSFTLEYELLNARTRAVVANASTVMVMYDYEAGRGVPISDEMRSKLEHGRR